MTPRRVRTSVLLACTLAGVAGLAAAIFWNSLSLQRVASELKALRGRQDIIATALDEFTRTQYKEFKRTLFELDKEDLTHTEPLPIGSRRELFVDDYLIDSMKNVDLQLHRPQEEEVALRFDEPWEGKHSGHVTVFKDGELYRMYYRGARGTGSSVTAYAESRDGIHWEKPNLGLFEYEGSKENNIVWTGRGTNNFAPFLDTNPDAPVAERYKALGGTPPYAFASQDGIHWFPYHKRQVLKRGQFDSQNVAFWDPVRERYVAYFRLMRNGLRDIGYSHSDDFIHWSAFPVPVDRRFVPETPQHLYTNATTPYFRAPHIFLAFPGRFAPDRKLIDEHPHSGVSDALFMSSRDGKTFDNRFQEAFVRPNRDRRNWTDRNNYVAKGVIPTGSGTISVFYTQHYRHETIHLRRASLRTDGFVSVNASDEKGTLVTKPLAFEGKHLTVNFETSAYGGVKVALLDQAGDPIPGFTLEEAEEMYGNSIEQTVTWEHGSDVSHLAGTPVRLLFRMRDADLYSLRFGE